MGLGGVGSRLRSFFFAALTREPDTELSRLVDLRRLFRSLFSFSLRLFSFFFLRREEELVEDGLLLFFFFSFLSSLVVGVSFDSPLELSAATSLGYLTGGVNQCLGLRFLLRVEPFARGSASGCTSGWLAGSRNGSVLGGHTVSSPIVGARMDGRCLWRGCYWSVRLLLGLLVSGLFSSL